MTCPRSFSQHVAFLELKSSTWKNSQVHTCSYTYAKFLIFLPIHFSHITWKSQERMGHKTKNTELRRGTRRQSGETHHSVFMWEGVRTPPSAAKPADHWEQWENMTDFENIATLPEAMLTAARNLGKELKRPPKAVNLRRTSYSSISITRPSDSISITSHTGHTKANARKQTIKVAIRPSW